MSDAINYDELDPGIRDVVRAINEWGWTTCDSGDGVSKPDFARTFDCPHVVATTEPAAMIYSADALAKMLVERFGRRWFVEATYSMKDGKALLVAMKAPVR